MTCIVGIIDEAGKAHIASDSLGSNGHTKGIYKNKKIFKKGNMLIGYTSSYRMGQLLEHSMVVPERKVNQILDNYMYIDFVNAIRNLFKDNGYLCINNNVESIGEFLILIEGRIFIMHNDLSMLESSDNFDSCGSGEDYARSTMYNLTNDEKLTPKEKLSKAIDTATQYVTTVGGEFQYLTND